MVEYSYDTLLVDKQDNILTITMNRPERLNAIDEVMHRELEDVFGAVGVDPEVSEWYSPAPGEASVPAATLGPWTIEAAPLLSRTGPWGPFPRVAVGFYITCCGWSSP